MLGPDEEDIYELAIIKQHNDIETMLVNPTNYDRDHYRS